MWAESNLFNETIRLWLLSSSVLTSELYFFSVAVASSISRGVQDSHNLVYLSLSLQVGKRKRVLQSFLTARICSRSPWYAAGVEALKKRLFIIMFNTLRHHFQFLLKGRNGHWARNFLYEDRTKCTKSRKQTHTHFEICRILLMLPKIRTCPPFLQEEPSTCSRWLLTSHCKISSLYPSC